MADLSLHYTSKAPLAGTFTAFNQIFATWRRRAKERRELSTLDARTLRDLGLSASDELDNNNGYGYFQALDALIVTEPTRTNVNDFRAILILESPTS